jgi:hypothetical protein
MIKRRDFSVILLIKLQRPYNKSIKVLILDYY